MVVLGCERFLMSEVPFYGAPIEELSASGNFSLLGGSFGPLGSSSSQHRRTPEIVL